MAEYNGTDGADIYTGTSDTDIIAGNGGADILRGGDGDDLIFSAARDFSITSAYYWLSKVASLDVTDEHDVLNGGAGDDQFHAGYNDSVDGGTYNSFGNYLSISFQGASSGVIADFRKLGSGNSIKIGEGIIKNIQHISYLEGSNFDDFLVQFDFNGYVPFGKIYGRDGNDTIIGTAYTGAIYGGTGNDTITRVDHNSDDSYGEEGDDTIYAGVNGGISDGGDGNDHIYGLSGYDQIFGGNGDDYIDAGAGSDTIDAGEGNDLVYGGGDQDRIFGEAGDDILFGDQSPTGSGSAYYPSTNNDVLVGGDGADTIHGDQGNDILCSGNAILTTWGAVVGGEDVGTEKDRLFGDGGDDTVYAGIGDDADGGAGTDTFGLSLAGATNGLTLDTNFFVAGGSFTLLGGTISNFEKLASLRLSAFADNLTVSATTGSLTVYTGGGDDVVTTGANAATVYGDAGDDRFVSGSDADTFDGGEGIDTIDYSAYASAVTVNLQAGSGAGDTLVSIENVWGSAFGDTISGSDADNVLRGDAGDDTLNGLGGNDTLIGGAGTDTLKGGVGDDTYILDADDGADVVIEGSGQGTDTVMTALASYTLTSNVENLVFSGMGAFVGTGNALANTITGGAGDDRLDGGKGADVLKGGLGNDTYWVDNAGDSVVEAANGGIDDVRVSIATYALADNVETLTYTGAGTFAGTGNALANTLTGGSGNDTLDGGLGNDTLVGGLGNDTYVVEAVGDSIVENAGEGIDTVRTTLRSYVLGANLEKLVYTGTLTFTGTGNTLDNAISGGDANDRLSGGTAGNDTLAGGLGNDIYLDFGRTGGKLTIVEASNGGVDTLQTDAPAIVLAANVENLVYVPGAGKALAEVKATGNAADNRIDLSESGGADVIDGGAGADIMIGGGGGDTYIVDNSGDKILELAGADGNDTVQTTLAAYTLALNVETLRFVGAGAFTGTGNGLANVLDSTAGSGNDWLDGGIGADIMRGGQGDDTYVVDNVGDKVVEQAGQGTDTVRTTLSKYQLGSEVENLTYSGLGAFTGIGNALANDLRGSNGNDILNGGAGADHLYGGLGNDRYYVDQSDDVVVESEGAGIDTVMATAGAYTLSDNVERLTYTGTASFEGTGNGLANILTGGGADDRLYGLDGADILYGKGGDDVLSGGLGRDVLYGGEGADTFVFADLAEFNGTTTVLADRIMDFSQLEGDRIDLSAIDAIAGGTDDAFTFIGTAAFGHQAGELHYQAKGGYALVSGDVDGDGVADFLLMLAGSPALTGADFVL